MYAVQQVVQALETSWDTDTAYPDGTWTLQNPARSQCVSSSLVVQHFFGGDLKKLVSVHNGKQESHYLNILPNGQTVDTTRSQYPVNQVLTPSQINLHGYKSVRDKMLHEPDTQLRYNLLLIRVQKWLAEHPA